MVQILKIDENERKDPAGCCRVFDLLRNGPGTGWGWFFLSEPGQGISQIMAKMDKKWIFY